MRRDWGRGQLRGAAVSQVPPTKAEERALVEKVAATLAMGGYGTPVQAMKSRQRWREGK